MNYTIDVTVTAPVNPTEVGDRVRRAVESIFPDAEITVDSDRVVATTHSIERFRELLVEQRIVDAARTRLRDARTDDRLEFSLKKQAAFHDTVNFAVGNPDELGDITVEIEVTDPSVDAFIDYLTPPTDDDAPTGE
ncbi:MAG: RNA-binding domain-containing protein [Halobacteriaceae archaeon]